MGCALHVAVQGEAEGSDDAVTLGLYGRMYYSEEDCEAEVSSLSGGGDAARQLLCCLPV